MSESHRAGDDYSGLDLMTIECQGMHGSSHKYIYSLSPKTYSAVLFLFCSNYNLHHWFPNLFGAWHPLHLYSMHKHSKYKVTQQF